MPEFRLGRRIGVDFGTARIGIAISSIDALICSPLATVINDSHAIENVHRLIVDNGAIQVFVGLPLNLKGDRTKSTDLAIDFSKELALVCDVPIRLIDERMSTRAAQAQMHTSGKNTKQSRGFIDAAAASLILENAMAFEKASGHLPGTDVVEF